MARRNELRHPRSPAARWARRVLGVAGTAVVLAIGARAPRWCCRAARTRSSRPLPPRRGAESREGAGQAAAQRASARRPPARARPGPARGLQAGRARRLQAAQHAARAHRRPGRDHSQGLARVLLRARRVHRPGRDLSDAEAAPRPPARARDHARLHALRGGRPRVLPAGRRHARALPLDGRGAGAAGGDPAGLPALARRLRSEALRRPRPPARAAAPATRPRRKRRAGGTGAPSGGRSCTRASSHSSEPSRPHTSDQPASRRSSSASSSVGASRCTLPPPRPPSACWNRYSSPVSRTHAARKLGPAARAPEQADVALARAASSRVGGVEGAERQVRPGDRVGHLGELLGEEEAAKDHPGTRAPIRAGLPDLRGYGCPHPLLRSGAARRIDAMCGRFTATFVEPQMIAERFAVHAPAIPEETLGRFNVCPTEQVLAVVSGPDGPRGARPPLGPRAAVGAQAARRARADQRARGDAARQAPLRAAARARRPPLPRDRRRLVRVAAARAPARRARAVPLHGRRRRAVRVRGTVGREPRRRRAARLRDSADDQRQRRLRARARPDALRARVGRGRGGLARARRRRAGGARAARACSRRRARRPRPPTPR